MTPQIVPVICTNQQVYDYMGISAVAAGQPLDGSGATLRSAFITRLMQFTATQIVQWCNHDYTTAQIINVNANGNLLSYWTFPNPIQTISQAKSWDPNNPNATLIDLTSPPVLVIQPTDPYTIFRNDGGLFSPWLVYYFVFVQAADPNNFNGWPLPCVQVQLEMINTIYRESKNNDLNDILAGFASPGAGMLGVDRVHQYLGTNIKWADMSKRWKDYLRGSRKIAI